MYEIMEICRYENIKIYKYENTQIVEKIIYQKCKRVCKESKYKTIK